MCDALCAPLEKALDELELRDHDEDEQQRHEDTVRDVEFGGEDIESEEVDAIVTPHLDKAFELSPDSAEAIAVRGYHHLRRHRYEEAKANFDRALQLNPNDVETMIGTSTLMAGWNAAVYVAQVDETRLNEAMSTGDYLDVTAEVLHEHQGLWFNNECFVVSSSRHS